MAVICSGMTMPAEALDHHDASITDRLSAGIGSSVVWSADLRLLGPVGRRSRLGVGSFGLVRVGGPSSVRSTQGPSIPCETS
jgi:hypothetical protein